MTPAFKTLSIAFGLAVLSVLPAFAQIALGHKPPDASAAKPVAYVYVGTAAGINLYYAATNGQLTLVNGSPFSVAGTLWGSNGTHLITMDNISSIYSYAIGKGGIIGKQLSSIDTQDYAGAECGIEDQATLDHSGQNVYVLLNIAGDDCAAYQSYNISKSTGELTFNDAVTHSNGGPWHVMPVFTGKDKLAYSLEAWDYGLWSRLRGYIRKSNGALEKLTFHQTDPKAQDGWQYWPSTITEDPTNHLAVGVIPYDTVTKTGEHIQLASYTVDKDGNISSTNAWENMPTADISPSSPVMSPSGKLLAVAGNQGYYPWNGGPTPNGLEVYHFNGAEPITAFSGVLTTTEIDGIMWDNNDHLYAMSGSANTVWVFTVTPTSITQAPGSPYTIPSGLNGGMLVVPVQLWM